VIRAAGCTEVRDLGAAMEGVPVVWVDASASLLGHPGRSVSRTFVVATRARAIFSDPGAKPPDPRPVDAAGTAAARGPLGNLR